MKRLEDLDELKQDIIRIIPSEEGLSFKELKKILEEDGRDETLNSLEIKENLKDLIKYGALKAYTQKEGEKVETKYYLTKGIGSGYRNQAKLLGKPNPIRDSYKFLKRMFGFIFILSGIGLFVYSPLKISGAAILEPLVYSPMGTSIVSFLLIFIGLIFLFKKPRH
ncbi:MAG: CD20-like domain-containing protein [Nanoarchaeota archaeon]|nr:CD20-like domain-containing protein [Nanoarchaeota archaeon]